jgi:hypothetical protein
MAIYFLHSFFFLEKMSFCLDKGDGSDAETSMSEEDIVLQDEICKSRLTSIKRVIFLTEPWLLA